MPKIRLHGYLGLAPKTDPVFLNAGQSQVALNTQLDGGALRSWRGNSNVTTLAKAGEIKTIFRVPTGEWLQFNEDVDIVKSPLADDATDRHYYTGTGALRVTNNLLVDIGGDDEYPEDSYLAGVPSPVVAPTATLVGTHTTPVDTAYVYTFVNAWGEESGPSPASSVVAADFSTGSVDLTTMDAAPAGDYVPITKWRIYRISPGTTGAKYLFVEEITINALSPQYNDTALSGTLTIPLATEGWLIAPTGLVGLTAMANGMLAGFIGNKVYICVPYVPYSYPEEYSFTFPVNIVGLGSFGSTLIVLTESNPYAISGITPGSMSNAKLPQRQACVSKRSIVSFGKGVAYACPNGVFYIGEDGYKLLTEKYYDREQWTNLTPSSSHAEKYDGKYIIFLTALKQGLILDSTVGPTLIDMDADAVWTDDLGDHLYMAIYDEVSSTTSIKEFNSSGGRLVYTWRSKSFLMPQLTAMTACKLNADFDASLSAEELLVLQAERDALEVLNAALVATGEICGDINGNYINELEVNGSCLYLLPVIPESTSYVLKIFGDHQLLVQQTVDSVEPFRVPISEKYNEYEIEISGSYPVRDVVLATSIRELKAYAQ
jgi:hypothetical protein